MKPGIGIGGDPSAVKCEEHKHHNDGDDDDVSQTDPMSLGFRGNGRPLAENAPISRHRSTRDLFQFAGFVVQLLPALVPENGRREKT